MNMDCLPHIHVVSWHAEPGYRASTPGVGCTWKGKHFDSLAGIYLNSKPKARPSAYALVAGKSPVTLAAGIVSGYSAAPILPFGGLLVRVDKNAFLVIPPTKYNPLTITYARSF